MKYTKDGITVVTTIDTRRKKANGLFPVKIQVIYNRVQKYYSTGKDLSIDDWNKLSSTKNRALVVIRESITNSFDLIRTVVDELAYEGRFSFDALNKRLKGGILDTVNTAFRVKIDNLKSSDRIGSMSIYDNVLKGIERFRGGHISFDVITVDWIKKYERYLLDDGKSWTTVGIHMRHLRAILNEAKRDGIIRESQYPFGRGKYEIQAGEGRKMALTLEQIGRIARYDDGSKATEKYRDYWLFLYLCNGINVADFVKLKYRDIVNGEICFVRQKTERTTRTRKEIRVIVSEPMRAIIDKWGNPPAPDAFIFPALAEEDGPLIRNNKTKYLTRAINKRMAAIGQALGIGNISTYTARHSFATVLKRSGANIAYISESLGHQDLKTTENYLASFEREEREKNAELLTKF